MTSNLTPNLQVALQLIESGTVVQRHDLVTGLYWVGITPAGLQYRIHPRTRTALLKRRATQLGQNVVGADGKSAWPVRLTASGTHLLRVHERTVANRRRREAGEPRSRELTS